MWLKPIARRGWSASLASCQRLKITSRSRPISMRLGLAQLNTIVGDLAGNRQKIIEAYAALVTQGAELVVFPELVVCGYPPPRPPLETALCARHR